MLPDPALYAQCLQDSHNELRDAALGGQTRKKARTRKKSTRQRGS